MVVYEERDHQLPQYNRSQGGCRSYAWNQEYCGSQDSHTECTTNV